MTNPVQAYLKVTACDNELFVIAATAKNSYLLANIKSGYSFKVDYTLNIKEGDFNGGTQNVNGLNGNISQVGEVFLNADTYSLVILGVDWGGSNTAFTTNFYTVTNGTTSDPISISTPIINTAPGKVSQWSPFPGAIPVNGNLIKKDNDFIYPHTFTIKA